MPNVTDVQTVTTKSNSNNTRRYKNMEQNNNNQNREAMIDKLGLEDVERYQLEMIRALTLIGKNVSEDQLDAIKRIYQSHCFLIDDSELKPALDIFFSYLTKEDLFKLDLTIWSFSHLYAWFFILDEDLFDHKNNDKPAYIFAARVNGLLLTKLAQLPCETVFNFMGEVSAASVGTRNSSEYGKLDCCEFDKLVADCYQITEREASHVRNF